jgi:hypothetical protein
LNLFAIFSFGKNPDTQRFPYAHPESAAAAEQCRNCHNFEIFPTNTCRVGFQLEEFLYIFFYSFLKEIPSERSALFEKYNTENATIRASLYPNLNYSGLFYGIVNLLDAFPLLTTAQTGPILFQIFIFILYLAIAEAILDTLKALYFFLDRDCIGQYNTPKLNSILIHFHFPQIKCQCY